MCLAKEDLSPVMEVQRLTHGWDQPFYWVIAADGSKRCELYPSSHSLPRSPVIHSDAAEEDLHPIDMRKSVVRRMFESRSVLSRYFEGVELDKTHTRGRLLPTQELQIMFPEDDQVGSSWVRRGTLGNRKPSFDTPSSR